MRGGLLCHATRDMQGRFYESCLARMLSLPPHDFGDGEEGDGISEDTFYLAKPSTVLLMRVL